MDWKTNIKNKLKTKLEQKFEVSREFLIFLFKRAKADAVLRVASSLSYTSLIAIVPLFAIALAIFSAFPIFSDVKEQVQNFLLASVSPNIEDNISEYFNEFISATAKLTTIGVVGLAVTAIMLLSTIENSFNFIFKVHKPRRFTTKITLYWTIVTLGPLLLGAAFSLRGYLFTIQSMMPEEIMGAELALGALLPSLITMLVLFFVYILVPNKKIGFVNAVCGALVSVILFGILRKGFAYFMLKSATYKTLYGAMAILPVFLVWMYLAWAVVIWGAVVTAALEEFQQPEANSLKTKQNKKSKKTIDNRTKTEQNKKQI